MREKNPINNSEIETAYRYCRSVTKAHAKSFYFAAKFLPKHKQKAVYPIYAFCRHVDDEIDEIGDGDEQAAIETVNKWKTQLENLYEEKENSKLKTGIHGLERPFKDLQNTAKSAARIDSGRFDGHDDQTLSNI